MPNTNSDGESNSNPIPIPNKPDRPPLLKKTKTIAAESLTPPHFPGPLFAAVRRVSPPSSSSSRRSFDSDSSATTDSFATQSFAFAERDYVYPSFLGPNTDRNRFTVKSSSSKSQRRELQLPQSPARSASMPSNLDSVRGKRVELVPRSPIRPDFPVPESELKPKAERQIKPVLLQVPPPSLSSSSSSSLLSSVTLPSAGRSVRTRSSLMLYLVSSSSASFIPSAWLPIY